MRPEGPEEPPALLLRPTPRLLRCHRPPQGPGARSLAVPLAGAGAPTPSTSCRLLPSPLCSSSLNKAALSETCRVRRPPRELARRKHHSVRRQDLPQAPLSRSEAIAEVKTFLIQLEAFLSHVCGRCEAAYRVLRWEDRAASTQFYGALLGSICVLYLLPLCWVLALLNSSLFLGNAEFYQVVLEFKATVEQQLGIRPIESPSTSQPAEIEAGAGAAAPLPDRTPTPTSAEDLTPGSVEEAEEAEPDEEFKDAIEEDDESSQCSVEFDLPDNGFLSKNEVIRSKVSRLTERLRKRCPSNNFGSCTGCAATFSVLKKRRSCSNFLHGSHR
ncbi:protrudin [Alligator mississippiensis]|uniref:Protrudin n=1 Tax=Alligator mississippiensis TaxID=8496 RepID=A0A151ML94_ALLMI|nr:protrudin [Alligator mississippiensis]